MKSQVLYIVRCNISDEAAGEIWNWSPLGEKGLSNPNIEIDQFIANIGTLYMDAQFTYTDDSVTSLSQPGFDIRSFGSSFDQ